MEAPEGTSFLVTAPGRICLFGEHQDYLGLPVVTLAVSRHVSVFVRPTAGSTAKVEMPDTGESRELDLGADPVPYSGSRDYLASGVNVLRREGYGVAGGIESILRGTIPINAGMSSSSALVVAWIAALLARNGHEVTPAEVARLAYLAEVREFGEAGGMMDHFSAALGNLVFLETSPEFVPHELPLPPGAFVVGNSLEKKSTVEDLRRVKERALDGFAELREVLPGFDLKATPLAEVRPFLDSLSGRVRPAVEGNLENRDLTSRARDLLSRPPVDPAALGALLSEHHSVLRDKIGVSTPKIEGMLSAALEAGALGGKINGSGFGGTMFVLVPPRRVPGVVEAIAGAGGDVFQVDPAPGVHRVVGPDFSQWLTGSG
ncbi:MAG: GHMP family kinase ATP-binding protein [Promethearchaeota archaeon]